MFVPEIYLKRWQSFLPHLKSSKTKVFKHERYLTYPSITMQVFDGEIVWSHTEPEQTTPKMMFFGKEMQDVEQKPDEDYALFKKRRNQYWQGMLDIEIRHLEDDGCHEGHFLSLVEIATEES